jgi:hypothetical protein
MASLKKIYFPDSLEARCDHVIAFSPMEFQEKCPEEDLANFP